MCYVALPKLNRSSKAFDGNGYQMPEEDLMEQPIERGDDKFFLLS